MVTLLLRVPRRLAAAPLLFTVACSSPEESVTMPPPSGVLVVDPSEFDEESLDSGTPTVDASKDHGGPTCIGSATPCTLLGSTQCAKAQGCWTSGKCSGLAASCYSKYDSWSCNDLDGCYWSSSSKTCSGSPKSCSSFTIQYSCEGQDGCSWKDTCEGVPTDCQWMLVTSCSQQPGCVLTSL